MRTTLPTAAGSACRVPGARASPLCAARVSGRSRVVVAAAGNSGPDAAASASFSRRGLVLSTLGACALAPFAGVQASYAEAAFEDAVDGFQLAVPQGWSFGEGMIDGNNSFSGASGGRRTLAWFPTDANPRDVNVTMVITNVSVEFTKLGSFGTPITFAENLVNSQDRSYLLKAPEWARSKEPIQVVKLVDAGARGDSYFVEYTVQKMPEAKKHLYSQLALGYNGRYNKLYTVTAQCPESEWDKYKDSFISTAKSLVTPHKAQIR